jgi:hypothetical protein
MFKNQNPQGELQMFDGVKIEINSESLCMDLMNNDLLKFITPMEEKTGEIHFPKRTKYNSLFFSLFESNRIEIRGSLHNHWKGENFSDFSFSELNDCLNNLEQNFGIKSNEARISNLEFGVNLNTEFNPHEFCSNLIAYKGEPFSKMRTSARNISIGKETIFSQYGIKIYNKSLQYTKEENILRIENSVKRMKYLSEVGITHLSDLRDKFKIKALGSVLAENLSHVVINDNSVKNAKLTANERRIYTECSNPLEWETFDRKKRHKRKIQFEQIISKHGERNWKELTEKMILNKWTYLLNS